MGSKISGYSELTATATGDEVEILDISDTSLSPTGTNKRITIATLLKQVFESFALLGDISPAEITANQNDYNPAGLSTAAVLRLSSDASRNITSIAGGSDGRVLIIHNVGSFDIVLKDDDGATGTAANRFALSGDTTLVPDRCAIIQYDSTSSRWRLLAGPAPAGGVTLHANDHENGGSDEIDVTGLSGVLADPQIAGAVLETSGPTLLVVDAVADGEFLKRSGSTVVSGVPAGTGAEAGANSDITSMDGLTGSLKAPTQIEDANGNELVKFGSTASAVNEVTVTNKATGNAPTVEATGADTNISLNLKSKGTGVVQANGVNVLLEFVQVACSDETTALTAGTGKITFRMPFAMTVTEVRASLTTAQSSGSIFTVDINEGGATILSTNLTIDNSEKTSTTAATPAVISDTALADDAEITIDIDQVGDGTAKGLKVTIIGVRG